MTEELVAIGKITRHQGNKGEVRVTPLTGLPNRFEELDRVYLVKNRVQKQVTIERSRYHKGFVILKFEGFDNIGQAIEHKGYLIKIHKSETAELPEDEYYLYDIIGLEVYTVEGEYLGIIEDVLETGANDVYIVKNETNEILIPAIKDVVLDVDLDSKKIMVRLLPGLR